MGRVRGREDSGEFVAGLALEGDGDGDESEGEDEEGMARDPSAVRPRRDEGGGREDIVELGLVLAGDCDDDACSSLSSLLEMGFKESGELRERGGVADLWPAERRRRRPDVPVDMAVIVGEMGALVAFAVVADNSLDVRDGCFS
jgi:hypothetical protein